MAADAPTPEDRPTLHYAPPELSPMSPPPAWARAILAVAIVGAALILVVILLVLFYIVVSYVTGFGGSSD
jgi:hypothetical protein